MISDELKTKILRYYYAELWRIGTIARILSVHHSVVRRVLSESGVSPSKMAKRESKLDPYRSFITETLAKYPQLCASRLYSMVRERGYTGGPDHFRHSIALLRPKPAAEAYLRLRTLPAEHAQIDWAFFDRMTIGKATRPLMAFVMVLSYSRKIFLRFYLNQQMANFMRGHEAAFEEWDGVPRVLLYDNLTSMVLERQGDAIRFNPQMLAFAAHYRFEPRPVAVARGNEKGRVERAIRYVRDNFFAARVYKDLDDLNHQAANWCHEQASHRKCPENKSLTVAEVFLEEQPKLLKLPDNPYPCDERVEVRVAKTPYVRFDLNDYSVPHHLVRRTLTVQATPDTVSILDGITEVATHTRCYDKGCQIEQEAHLSALTAEKYNARLSRGQDRLMQALPIGRDFLVKAAEKGYVLKTIVTQLLALLDRYGANALGVAMKDALSKNMPHPNAVRKSLEMQRLEHHEPPPIGVDLPDDKRVRDLVITPHSLDQYDQLHSIASTGDNDNEQ